jgi:hypothetical protein
MVDIKKGQDEVADQALNQINQIKKAAGEFRNNVAGLVKDMHVDATDWHINVESHEKGVTVDVSIKLLITKKE